MSHYFIKDENLKSERKEIKYYYKKFSLSFITDNGVFSKDHVDPASDILMNNIEDIKGKLLDLGCGYGVIGISLSKEYDIELTQCDVNPLAIELTKINCEKNAVTSNVIESNCFDNITAKYDVITLNPPIHAGKEVTYKMYEQSYEHLVDGGKLFIVTLKKHGAESTIKKLQEVYGNCEVVYKKKPHYILKCVK